MAINLYNWENHNMHKTRIQKLHALSMMNKTTEEPLFLLKV